MSGQQIVDEWRDRPVRSRIGDGELAELVRLIDRELAEVHLNLADELERDLPAFGIRAGREVRQRVAELRLAARDLDPRA